MFDWLLQDYWDYPATRSVPTQLPLPHAPTLTHPASTVVTMWLFVVSVEVLRMFGVTM